MRLDLEQSNDYQLIRRIIMNYPEVYDLTSRDFECVLNDFKV